MSIKHCMFRITLMYLKFLVISLGFFLYASLYILSSHSFSSHILSSRPFCITSSICILLILVHCSINIIFCKWGLQKCTQYSMRSRGSLLWGSLPGKVPSHIEGTWPWIVLGGGAAFLSFPSWSHMDFEGDPTPFLFFPWGSPENPWQLLIKDRVFSMDFFLEEAFYFGILIFAVGWTTGKWHLPKKFYCQPLPLNYICLRASFFLYKSAGDPQKIPEFCSLPLSCSTLYRCTTSQAC